MPPVSVCPTTALPVIVGGEVLDGAIGALAEITAVWFEIAVLDPAVFDPVTSIRTVVPTSRSVSVYVCDVAPRMLTQLEPVWSQLSHW